MPGPDELTKRHGDLERRKKELAARREARIAKSESEPKGLTFSGLVESKGKQADAIVQKVTDAVAAACVMDELGIGEEKTTRFVVNMDKETREAIDRGLIKLDRGKDGRIYAQLRDAENHYGKKLSISEELAEQGVDGLEAMNALQLKAIQAQLAEMAKTIDAISRDVETVIQGQQNDRLGLFQAGKSLLLEAQSIQDPTFRKLLSSQALASLSEASAQLSLQLEIDIKYLVEGKYSARKGKQFEEIDDRMDAINKGFQAIHEAVLLKASVYYEAGELPAMLAAVSDYGCFLESAVVPNAPRLAEYDRADNLLRGGTWETRSRSLSGVEDIKQQLTAGASFYLEAPKEDDNEG